MLDSDNGATYTISIVIYQFLGYGEQIVFIGYCHYVSINCWQRLRLNLVEGKIWYKFGDIYSMIHSLLGINIYLDSIKKVKNGVL